MACILGIDPGSRKTGYGVIAVQGRRLRVMTCGTINVMPAGETLALRLHGIFKAVRDLMVEFAPDQVAIEKVFVQRNVESALKLGQARGAAICACADFGIPVFEYSPTQIKKSVVGNGHASKAQIQHMIVKLLGLTQAVSVDAADALACAFCHHNHRPLTHRLAVSFGTG